MKKEKNLITKCKLFFDPDKEVAYINKMNQQGWKLVFIKWGMFFTFEKCEPCEYITLLHSEKKENLSKVSSFAIQCGYEIIPHTIDGLGNTLYLTGRKEDVSENFVSDKNDKIEFYQIFKKNFQNFFIAYLILDVFFILFDVFLTVNVICNHATFSTDVIAFFIIYYLISAIYVGFTAKLIQIIIKYNKKIKKLKQEALIFE